MGQKKERTISSA